MPNYDYYCNSCERESERNVKMDMRDEQTCDNDSCHMFNQLIERKITFNGTVWSPTATGAGHR